MGVYGYANELLAQGDVSQAYQEMALVHWQVTHGTEGSRIGTSTPDNQAEHRTPRHPERGVPEGVRRLRGFRSEREESPGGNGEGQVPGYLFPGYLSGTSALVPIGTDGVRNVGAGGLEETQGTMVLPDSLGPLVATRRFSRPTLRRTRAFVSGWRTGLTGPILVVGVCLQFLHRQSRRVRNQQVAVSES